jgi:hypothetical protein
MSLALILAALAQPRATPGPLDAFRANHAAIRASIDFAITDGMLESSAISDDRPWDGRAISFAETPRSEIIGTWSCYDGVEHLFSGSPDPIIAEGRKKLAGQKRRGRYVTLEYTPKVESLFDGETLAEHFIDEPAAAYPEQTITVWGEGRKLAVTGKGPFSWWDYPFPSMLRVHFPGVTPRITKLTRCGVPTEAEIYVADLPKGWQRLEVAYDPAVGYLPRHTRWIVFSREVGKAAVYQTFLVKAQPCASGGFVPIEWYYATFHIESFESAYPSCDETTIIVPREKRVFGMHFQATSFQNLSTPVALTHLKVVRSLSSMGGQVSLRQTPSRLTMADLKARLGRRLTAPAPAPLPSIDVEELHEFDHPVNRWRAYLWAAGLIGLAVIGLIVASRGLAGRPVASLLLAAGIGLCGSGCGHVGQPIIKLSAAFERPTFLYEGGPKALPMTLIVRNDGNLPVHIFSANGGCTCRRIDQFPFPCDLRPGDYLKLPLTYDASRNSSPQVAKIMFETNQGSITTTAPF